jgi:NAD(P)-dependent dehydrogenase (short-subunit alcohol dehydrogenase family)
MARAALRHFQPGAVILNTGSVTGMDGSPELLDYAATKGAIHAFTKSLAQNLVKQGIRVNGVAPGPVWTPLNPADQPAEDVAEFGAPVNAKRPAQPEEIAPAFVSLASEADASYITGEILSIFGGEPTN